MTPEHNWVRGGGIPVATRVDAADIQKRVIIEVTFDYTPRFLHYWIS